MNLQCVHSMGTRMVHKVDCATNKPLKNEWWWFCNCDLLGDEQEIGYECGKGHCELYKKAECYKRKKNEN